jgi:hypothetical protein
MSDAIDNADVMIYAVSTLYKESGNCRLEANYAHQVGLLSLCAPPPPPLLMSVYSRS